MTSSRRTGSPCSWRFWTPTAHRSSAFSVTGASRSRVVRRRSSGLSTRTARTPSRPTSSPRALARWASSRPRGCRRTSPRRCWCSPTSSRCWMSMAGAASCASTCSSWRRTGRRRPRSSGSSRGSACTAATMRSSRCRTTPRKCCMSSSWGPRPSAASTGRCWSPASPSATRIRARPPAPGRGRRAGPALARGRPCSPGPRHDRRRRVQQQGSCG
mmetsp:Transcript_100418/g.324080  ORF Transcript_100418/g.324080 Transcript_100418/m.324080 type:complete len:215 (-) Transcript_100418:196-840(-)